MDEDLAELLRKVKAAATPEQWAGIAEQVTRAVTAALHTLETIGPPPDTKESTT